MVLATAGKMWHNTLYTATIKQNLETYRSGHNGADSKSVWEQSHEGSNPSVSAIKPLKTLGFQGFFISQNAVKVLSYAVNAVNAVTEFAEMQLKPAIPVFHSRSIEKSLKCKMQ